MRRINRESQASKYERLISRVQQPAPVVTAVAHACDASSLGGAMEAAELGIIRPILVGPAAKILAAAEAVGVSLGDTRIVDVPHSHAAAQAAVELVKSGEAELLMKGSLHADELMAAVETATTNGDNQDPFQYRGGCALQDGRPWPGQRRLTGRPARL